MLERVPVAAESTAHLFFRRLDRPYRSSRSLDTRFWQHGAQDIPTTSVWWSSYLADIRQVPQAQRGPSTGHSLTQRGGGSTARPIGDTAKCASVVRNKNARHYTRNSTLKQSAQPARVEEETEEFYDAFPMAASGTWPLQTTYEEDSHLHPDDPKFRVQREDAPINEGASKPSVEEDAKDKGMDMQHSSVIDPIHKRFLDLLKKNRRATSVELDESWALFLGLSDQEQYAPSLLRLLRNSRDERHLSRALQAYRLIPRKRRDTAIYSMAMGIYVQTSRMHEATNLAFEAQVRGFDLLPRLFAYFVKEGLWTFAVDIFKRNRDARSEFRSLSHLLDDRQGRLLQLHELFAEVGNFEELPQAVLDLDLKMKKLITDRTSNDLDEYHNLRLQLTKACLGSRSIVSSSNEETLFRLTTQSEGFGYHSADTQLLGTLYQSPRKYVKFNLAMRLYKSLCKRIEETKPAKRSLSKIPPWVVNGLLDICKVTRQPISVHDSIVQGLRECGQTIGIDLYHRMLSSYARLDSPSKVEGLFKEYVSVHGMPKNIGIVTPLLYVHAARGDTDAAEAQFTRIKDEFGFEQNAYCWNMLIYAYARSRNDAQAYDVYDRMLAANERADTYTYGTLMSVAAAHGDVVMATELLGTARALEVPVSGAMIGTLVEAYLSRDDAKTARKLILASLPTSSDTTRTRLCNSLMRHVALKGDLTKVNNIRKDMVNYGVQADAMTYAAIALALSTNERTDEATTMLRRLHQKKEIHLTRLHYRIILQGFVLEKDANMVNRISAEMQHQYDDMAPTVQRAKILLKMLSGEAIDFGSTMYSNYSSLLQPVRQSENNEDAKLESSVKTLDSEDLNFLFGALYRMGKYEGMQQLIDALNQYDRTLIDSNLMINGQPSRLTLARMDLAVATSNFAEQERIWSQVFEHVERARASIAEQRRNMTEKSIKSRKMLSSAVNDLKKRPPMVEEIQSSSWKYSLSVLLNTYMEAKAKTGGRLGDVAKVFQNLLARGFDLTGYNYNKYIQILCRSRMLQDHIKAFEICDKHLLNRAQSWELLRNNILRTQNVSYLVQSSKPGGRPVLEKQVTYAKKSRSLALKLDPARKIPTYHTMVCLAAVLLSAQTAVKKATTKSAESLIPSERMKGNRELQALKLFASHASRTKRFLQQMPYLKDPFQGKLLRGNVSRADPPLRSQKDEGRERFEGLTGPQIEEISAEFLLSIQDVIQATDGTQLALKPASRQITRPQNFKQKDTIDMHDERKASPSPPSPTGELSVTDLAHVDTKRVRISPAARRVSSRRTRYALPYVEDRRYRRSAANAQREHLDVDPRFLSPRALQPRTRAAKKAEATSIAKLRLTRYRMYEDDLRAGRRLEPFPKTADGVRRRLRRTNSFAPIRFTADLGRRRSRIFVRRGLAREKRLRRLPFHMRTKARAAIEEKRYRTSKVFKLRAPGGSVPAEKVKPPNIAVPRGVKFSPIGPD